MPHVWSIDVGHRNMGLAILDVSEEILKALEYRSHPVGPPPDKSKMLWKDVSVVYRGTHDAWGGKTAKFTLLEINHNMHLMIDTLVFTALSLVSSPRFVLIEDQPLMKYKGKTNVSIQWFMHGVFAAFGIQSAVVSPKLKMSRHVLKQADFDPIFSESETFENAKKYTYNERKSVSLRVAQRWHQYLGNSTTLLRQLSSHFRGITRADDSDALLQLVGLFGQLGVNNAC